MNATRTEAMNLLTKARALVLLATPYIAPIQTRLVHVWREGLGTFAVSDKGHFVADPEAVIRFGRTEGSVEALAGIVLHEDLHVLLAHHLRRGDRDAKIWNIAADLWINSAVLRVGGLDLPDVAYFAADAKGKEPTVLKDQGGASFTVPGGMDAYEIYDYLIERALDPEGCPQAFGGDCGSGAGGEPQPGEPQEGETDEDGEPLDSTTEAEMESARGQVAQAAQKDAAKAGGAGLSGALGVWAAEVLAPPQLSWRALLRVLGRSTIAQAGRKDQSYRRPARRSFMSAHPRNPIRPVEISNTPRVLFAVDTSGSMSRRDHALVLRELAGMVGHGEVWLTACDSEVQGEAVRMPRSPGAGKSYWPSCSRGAGGQTSAPYSRGWMAPAGGIDQTWWWWVPMGVDLRPRMTPVSLRSGS